MTVSAAWRDEAVRYLKDESWGAAQSLLREVLEAEPRQAQAWVWLGEALEHDGQRAAAWRAFDRGWMLDPQAVWAPAARERLADAREGEIPDWLASLLAVPRVRVVGAVLCKDEAENIGRCLDALMPAVDEVVVVDTGSTDDTVAIAEAKGAKVVHHTWSHDFGAARNAALPLLGEEGWVLWVDADEFLDPDDRHVPRTIAGLYHAVEPPMFLRIVQVNYIGDHVEPNYDTTRMYPLGRGIVWKGRIHEQVVFAEGARPMQRGVVRIRLDHWGYEREVMNARGKLERNIRLLREWANEEPKNPAAWGFLGRDLYVSGRLEEAVEALSHAEVVAAADPSYARLPEVRGVLCEALVRLHRLEEARAVAERLTDQNPDFPTGWYWRAQIALLQSDERLLKAREWAKKAVDLAPTYRGIVSISPEIPRFLAPIALADAAKMLGLWSEALANYEQALRVKPEHEGVRRQIDWITQEARRIAEREPNRRFQVVR